MYVGAHFAPSKKKGHFGHYKIKGLGFSLFLSSECISWKLYPLGHCLYLDLKELASILMD